MTSSASIQTAMQDAGMKLNAAVETVNVMMRKMR